MLNHFAKHKISNFKLTIRDHSIFLNQFPWVLHQRYIYTASLVFAFYNNSHACIYTELKKFTYEPPPDLTKDAKCLKHHTEQLRTFSGDLTGSLGYTRDKDFKVGQCAKQL